MTNLALRIRQFNWRFTINS